VASDQAPTWQRSIPRGQTWGGCRLCEHLRPGFRCTAYPNGIPLPIVSGEIDHLVARPGQVGTTVFEVVERPDDIQRATLESAARRGAAWALRALARSR
jgi:hypothetical protein